MRQFYLLAASLLFSIFCCNAYLKQTPPPARKNVILILADDHRHDFMGFTGKVPFLRTPGMDRIAREGAHLKNAFVTTALCSPSRASILTGQYTHHHGVVDNQSLISDTAVFFPKYLQDAGYQTAMVGKWHMGEHTDAPQPGFDYWASFRGQGTYFNPVINIDGTQKTFGDSAYVTDVLTGLALDFLRGRDKGKPFFLYLSHKAVHAEFYPAPRHRDRYAKEPIQYPPTMFPPGHPRSTVDSTQYDYANVPNWVKAQRYSWHGVDYMYHGAYDFETFYRRYCETLLALDESIAQVLQYLDKEKLWENTVVIYMGDNGFSFGEHGLIDKRHAYEESWRVPMLAMGGGIPAGSAVDANVQNIDIGPTVLDLAGLSTPAQMDGKSFLPLLLGQKIPWRETIFYEYFWERPFPQTPTVHAVRTARYKYIRYHGIWDINELYDLQNDPNEMRNLIRDPAYARLSEDLRNQLFDWIEKTGGEKMFLRRDEGERSDNRYKGTY